MTDPIGVGSMARKMVVVGIGCSADRLDALRHLLGNMPTGTGMVYVVIAPPASPGSAIDELVGDIALPVVEAADATTMTADHVYLAPAGSVVTVDGLRLRVRRPDPGDAVHHPIDVLFGSLARNHARSAVGILLAADGTDGTLGLQAIQEHGGLTITQVAGRSTPSRPVLQGWVDLVLAAEEIPAALHRHALRGGRSHGTLRHAAEKYFPPAHVVVDAEGNVVHVSAHREPFLEMPDDRPGQHLLLVTRKELRADLQGALQQVFETGQAARPSGILVDVGRERRKVDLSVEPLHLPSTETYFLVAFNDAGPVPVVDGNETLPNDGDPKVGQLESELRENRERLQDFIDEHEEGVEKLRSGNEELKTNAAEVRSTNEELNMVNAELMRKIEQLHEARNDLENVVDSTQIALVFVDRELRIRSFTGAAVGLFNLVPSDCGRPLSEMTHKLDYTLLDQNIHAAVTNSEATEQRVVARDGQGHYLLRVLPYHGTDGATDGATVTLIGIDMIVSAENRLRASVDELNTRLQQQGAIAEFGAMALRATNVDALLTESSSIAAKCLGIQRAKVLQLLPDGAAFLVKAGVGWSPDIVGKAIVGADSKSPAGVALMTGEPVVSENLELDERFEVPKVLRDHGIESAINVIIRGEGEPFGVLEVDSQQPRRFGPDDVNFLQSCANLVAAALDRLRSEADLQRAFEEKQVLLYELQHRVKNSLQEMSALVNIERRKAVDLSLRRALEVLGARLEALKVIYRKLYLVDHHTEIDLGDYLGELTGDLFAFHGVDPQGIGRDLQLEEVRVNLDQALPLGLIVCEFIVNSLKHAFPEGRGRISLTLERKDETQGQLVLGDNGTGLPAPGNPGSGSGLQLIRRLVAQIGGAMDLTGPDGVTMTIVFPLHRQALLN